MPRPGMRSKDEKHATRTRFAGYATPNQLATPTHTGEIDGNKLKLETKEMCSEKGYFDPEFRRSYPRAE